MGSAHTTGLPLGNDLVKGALNLRMTQSSHVEQLEDWKLDIGSHTFLVKVVFDSKNVGNLWKIHSATGQRMLGNYTLHIRANTKTTEVRQWCFVMFCRYIIYVFCESTHTENSG